MISSQLERLPDVLAALQANEATQRELLAQTTRIASTTAHIDDVTTRTDERTGRIEQKIDELHEQPPPDDSHSIFDNRQIIIYGHVYQAGGNQYIGSTHLEAPGDATINLGTGSLSVPPNPLPRPGGSLDKVVFRDWLVRRFGSLEELEDLCLYTQQRLARAGNPLPLSLDIVGGNGLQARCQKLIEYLDRRGLLNELVEEARRLRPNVE